MAKQEKPTPENTPLPGGGSWRWDDKLPGWVSNDAYAPPPIGAESPAADVAQPAVMQNTAS